MTNTISQKHDHYRSLGCLDNLSIPDYFYQVVQAHGEKTAVISGSQTYSFNKLWQQIKTTASLLIENDIKSGDHLVLQMPNDEHFIITFLAVLSVGAIPVLMLPSHRQFELEHFIRRSQAKAVILSSSIDGQNLTPMLNAICASSTITLFSYGTYTGGINLSSTPEHIQPLPDIPADNMAFFLLSGGTTGLPKLIPRYHAEYIYNIHISATNAELNESSKYLASLPMAHNFALGCPGILGTLFNAGTVIISKNGNAKDSFKAIEQYHISHCALVPPLASLWADSRAFISNNLSSLKVLQVGGSRVSHILAQKLMEAFPGVLQQSYGMGEGLLCQTHRQDNMQTLLYTQGRPLSPYDDVRVVDASGQIISERPAKGELQVKGPYTITHYYSEAEYNQKAFTDDGFYATGDLALMYDDGTLVIEGRINDVINRGGDKIGPDELEDHLLKHPDIKEVSVVAIDDDVMGERVCAMVVSTEKLRLIDIKRYLKSCHIAEYKLPDKLIQLNKFPETHFGKTDRKQLRQLANSRSV